MTMLEKSWNILEYLERCNEKEAALIFLGAEKSFDNLKWTFLFKVLEETNFGENFING